MNFFSCNLHSTFFVGHYYNRSKVISILVAIMLRWYIIGILKIKIFKLRIIVRRKFVPERILFICNKLTVSVFVFLVFYEKISQAIRYGSSDLIFLLNHIKFLIFLSNDGQFMLSRNITVTSSSTNLPIEKSFLKILTFSRGTKN